MCVCACEREESVFSPSPHSVDRINQLGLQWLAIKTTDHCSLKEEIRGGTRLKSAINHERKTCQSFYMMETNVYVYVCVCVCVCEYVGCFHLLSNTEKCSAV